MEDKKKLKDTAVGKWLEKSLPHVLDVVGNALPDKGVLGVVKRLVDSEPDLTPEQRMEFSEIAARQEMNAQDNVTKRWESDMSSDVKLAKVIRPSVLITILLFFMAVMIWDGVDPEFSPRENYIDLLQIVMLTVFGAYFAGRTIEKTKR
jgi:hypothetical protein